MNHYFPNQKQKSAEHLKKEYLSLLDKNRREQVYQKFLEENTRLIPREFVQNHGINYYLVFRKLSFGSDYESDFMYLSKSSDDWNCILVEIEKPSTPFFKGSTNDLHPDFMAGINQIKKWKAWFLNNSNKTHFINSTLGAVRTPLSENPTFMKYVLVTGRRSEYQKNPIRRSIIASQEDDDFKILSFDSLAEDLESKHDLYVAARKNEYIDIISENFLSENLFAWMPSEQIRISEKLKQAALSARSRWFHYRAGEGLAMDLALPRVRIRPTKKRTK